MSKAMSKEKEREEKDKYPLWVNSRIPQWMSVDKEFMKNMKLRIFNTAAHLLRQVQLQRRRPFLLAVALVLSVLLFFYISNGPLEPTDDINFLLVGRTGSGKSTSGNLILGKHVFKTGISPNSITKHFQMESAFVLGRNVTVVDGPGLGDTKMTDEESVKMVIAEGEKALAACPEGFDAILITIPLGRYTEQDKQIFLQLKAIFGENYIRDAGIILVTHGDNYKPQENEGKSFEDWYPEQTGLFQEFVTECDGRVILFGRHVYAKELEKLFEITRNKIRLPERYSKSHFNDSLESRKVLLVKIREPELSRTVSQRIADILEELSNATEGDPDKNAIIKLQELMDVVDILELKVKAEDKETGVLNHLLDQIRSTKAIVDSSLGRVKTALKLAEDIRQMKQQLDNHEVESDKERQKLQDQILNKEQILNADMNRLREKNQELMQKLAEARRGGEKSFSDILGDLKDWLVRQF